ncbi:18238_t:CDS:2 [Acaulospora morrowiae]|uniref:18238_t:CDS:1 n=1 Tax=Acaulospora morrowiae TaxID=94023 RepID=A0A9N9B8D4_9GLOM|nr:18238_t:CDS:2 [Acaulospora morrowiae]
MPQSSTIDFQDIIFIDCHGSHIREDVIKALNTECLEIIKIPSGITSVLQPPDVSVNKPFKSGIRQKWDEWISDGKKEFTINRNYKKVSYELICKWVSEVWKEINQDLLIKSFKATGLILNSDGSENNKMSTRLQAIIENHIDDIIIDESEENDILSSEELDLDNMIENEISEEISNDEISDKISDEL